MNALPPDWRERETALDIQQSFICEAPAGSGKTELLTQRLLALLANADKPEEILAITFTRKAAAEMRSRVLEALKLANQSEQPQEKHKLLTWTLARKLRDKDNANNWQLPSNPQRLRIQTFDSFCASITRQLPLSSALGGSLQVSDEPEEIYQLAVNEILKLVESDSRWQTPLATLLSHLDNNVPRLEQLLIDLLGKREAWIPVLAGTHLQDNHRHILQSHLQHIIDDKIADIVKRIPLFLVNDLLSLCHFAALNLRKSAIETPLSVFADLKEELSSLPTSTKDQLVLWEGIRLLLLTNSGEYRKKVDKRNGFPVGDGEDKKLCKQRKLEMQNLLDAFSQIPDLLEALQELFNLPASTYEDKQWEVLDALTQILPLLVAQLHICFKEVAAIDFTEISLRASQALGEDLAPTDLALRLDYKIKHILVDEFQDSSINQLHLIRQLTRGWQPGDGRTLFCVGDAMQSIYGFRGANVGLFLYCKEYGIGEINPETIQLKTNFRSQAGLVNWFNRVFSAAFPGESNIASGGVPYSSAEAVLENLEQPAVLTHWFSEENYASQEARSILELIRQTQTDTPDASIAILVRNRAHATHILPLLKEAQINYQAVDLQTLRDKMIVQDLLSLTRALLHPGDKLAWLSVLRAPWCGLNLTDLESVAITNNAHSKAGFTVAQKIAACLPDTENKQAESSTLIQDLFDENQRLSSDGEKRLQQVFKVLKLYEKNRQRMPLRQWIEGCWLELGGPACLQAEEDRENAEAFFSLLEQQDQHGTLKSFEHFEKRLDRLFAQPNPHASSNLQVMTIHKSKGLEFDVVILPALHKTQRPPKPELFLWQTRLRANGEEELVFAPITEKGQETEPTYKHLQEQNSKKEKLESCRLLYVACTRAKKHLHLCAAIGDAQDEQLKPPPKNSMLHYIWPQISDEARLTQSDQQASAAVNVENNLSRRLPSNWVLPELPEIHTLDKYIASHSYDNRETSAPLMLDPTAKHIGTLTHQILQELAIRKLDNWAKNYAQNKDKLQQNWRARLLTMGLPLALLDSALQGVELIVNLILQDKNIAWMFSGEHKEIYPEYAINMAQQDGTVSSYVIDLLIHDKQSTTWIIDYKTSSPTDGQEVEDFINNEKEKYQFIMKQYSAAIAEMGYKNIKSALYFPVIQQWGYYT